jgi:tetratricopeptide (TPR) repeat protein
LVSLIKSDLFEFHQQGKIEDVARDYIFLAAGTTENNTVRNFLFQQGKRWIDSGLKKSPKNMALRNALIVYQSEFANQPMMFLATLKESYSIDSNDVELNFIHLNLLKKSNQLEKAIKKCEKLVSLQPQNPYWLFEVSDIYGQMGDSTNAKVYLDLAVKVQRNSKQN